MDEEKTEENEPVEEENLEETYGDYKDTLTDDEDEGEPDSEFSMDTKNENEAASEAEEEEADDTEGPKIPRNETFDEDPGGVDAIMREALTDTESIDVTDNDRTSYLKAVLNDVPVILNIKLCNEQVKIDIRSRSSWEQTCIYVAVKKDQEEGIINDIASVVIQLQKYGAVLMIKSVNDEHFSTVSLSEADGIDDCVTLLREKRMSMVEPLSMPKWTLMLNALRVYETKIARMGTECLNENFWEPVD